MHHDPTVPAAARGCVACAALAAAAVAAPALRPGADLPWGTVALLAAVCAGGERLPRRGLTLPVLLTGAFLLPPAAAALAAVPGGLAGRSGRRRPAPVRRLWHAAQLALAAGAASYTFALAGAPVLPDGPSAPLDGRIPAWCSALPGVFPALLLPAVAAALVFSLVSGALDGAIRVAAERRSPAAACRGALAGAPLPVLAHGPAALVTAVLWRSGYGPLAALLVLLPLSVSAWFLDRRERERAAQRAAVRALVRAVDLKDPYTRGHGERVGRAGVLIARELGLAGERLEALRFAGTLHDVGKLAVPTGLLRKDGPLTPEERRVIELHPEYGQEIVRGIGFLDEARSAVLHHHERLDGSGYPHGLTGHHIPYAARVVAVADAFDAMTSTRSYSRARPVPVALAELRRCAGTQFDPRVVDALCAALDRHGWHPAAAPGSPCAGPAPEARRATPPAVPPSGNVPSPSELPLSPPGCPPPPGPPTACASAAPRCPNPCADPSEGTG
ncbi:HD-GYP domain-containing protein [Streptomyces gamaensis]|uniref:HD-GYP domain-containing protein n=1 Tax=Streptomyces gamaensis TaxID=1763542 RepID=A0ABW0YTJ0_9ACTN